MRNPLREMSRPKALATAGIVAGAVAIGGVAAALNVGLLTSNDGGRFTPQNVASTNDGSAPTTSTTPPVEIVYQDVYEQAPTASPAAGASTATADDRSDDVGSYDDGSHPDDSSGSHDDDHESEDEDHESEDEDHGSEDHEDEGDGFDD